VQTLLLAATAKFDESFYAAAAQVIPVLLLTLSFQLRLRHRRDDEELGLTFFLLALFLALAIGELLAFVALDDHKNLPKIGVLVIWGAVTWGVMMIAARPVFGRWDAIHGAIPLSLSLAIRYGLLLAVIVLPILVTFGVVGGGAFAVLGGIVVFGFLVVGMVVSDVESWRKMRRRASD
jgi:hypothetical protein